MKDTSVYLNNFFDTVTQLSINDDLGKSRSLVIGTSPRLEKNFTTEKIASDFLINLLLYDSMFIKIKHIDDLVDVFGFNFVIRLLEENILKVIDDKGYFSPLIDIDCLFSAGVAFETVDLIEMMEKDWINKYPQKKEEQKKLLYHVEKSKINYSTEKMTYLTIKELNYDFKVNKDTIFVNTDDIKRISPKDAVNILRIISINQSMIIGEDLNISNIVIDGILKKYLPIKLSPLTMKNEDKADVFLEIMKLKQIPDLSKLFLNKSINLEDILKIRNNINGRFFRHWYNAGDYDKEKFIKILLDKSKLDSNNVIKFIRWSIPNIIGLKNSLFGIALSGADSYIIDKLVKGWNPSFFLDDTLKGIIDKREKDFIEEKKLEQVMKYFPNLTYNDRCPCGSKKLFGKCCGKKRRK